MRMNHKHSCLRGGAHQPHRRPGPHPEGHRTRDRVFYGEQDPTPSSSSETARAQETERWETESTQISSREEESSPTVEGHDWF